MSEKGTTRIVAETLGAVFEPLVDAFGEGGNPLPFFRRLGWTVTAVPKPYNDLAVVISGILDKVAASRDGTADNDQLVGQIIDGVVAIHGALGGLPAPTGVDATKFLEDLASKVVQLLVCDYLSSHVPTLFNALVSLGIIANVYQQAEVVNGVERPAFVERQILYGEIPAVLADPRSIPKRVVGWGTPNLRFDDLAQILSNVFEAVGLSAAVIPIQDNWRDGFGVDLENRATMSTSLQLSLAEAVIGDTPIDVTVALLDAPVEPGHPLPGVVLQPLIPSFTETIPVGTQTTLTVKGGLEPQKSFGLFLRPNEDPEIRFPFATDGTFPDSGVQAEMLFAPTEATVLLGKKGGSRVEVNGAALRVKVEVLSGKFQVTAEAEATGLNAVIAANEGDGFIGKLLDGKTVKVDLPSGIRWSNVSGVSLIGAAGFEIQLASAITLGPLVIKNLKVALKAGESDQHPALLANVGADLGATLGPISAAVQNVGVGLTMTFEPGNVGPFNLDVGFKPPTGVGIAVNGGPVSGGGFLSFEDSKYSGALALSVYAVAVKAFGIIETKFPDGHRGFSFIIIISAEFTPIQLGFGFTLNGVGGILGINRDLNEDALRDVVQRGSMGNVLFPKDPIKDAPSILHDIAQLFPAADGHFVFGPMAILAWGTPAIVEARLGIIIVFPGPRIALLGTVQVLLPPGTGQQAPDKRLVEIHLDIAGVLDFPKKHFALDAHLHDSKVVGYPISGDMAARIDWGANPNMAIAMGGFHPHFTPPAGFPKLRRLAIDLGIKGNPSATLSGYMAVTSNTAQIGAALDVTASAGGASLKGGLAFDAIFVFSPFSFDATLEGGVHVDFHGAGFGMHFHGHISGPAPWHLNGDVCVSILWWDACVGFDLKLGGEKKPELPAIDVWAGSTPAADGSQDVPGLQSAISAPGNWTALMPPNGYQAVSLRATDASSASRVDPLGTAKFEQKVLPFKLAISRFAGRDRAKNDAVTVTLNKIVIDGDDLAAAGRVNPESDFFAPAQYQKLPDAQALSSPSFQPMQAGFSFTSRDLKAGVEKTKVISFQTFVVGNPGKGQVTDFPVNDTQLLAMTSRSAVATGGLRTGNIDRFVDFSKQSPFTLTTEVYALAFKSTLKRFTTATDDAAYALTADKLAAQSADVRATLQIVPVHELAA